MVGGGGVKNRPVRLFTGHLAVEKLSGALNNLRRLGELLWDT